MFRQHICGLMALILLAGVGLGADDAKKAKNVTGKFDGYSPGVLKLEVRMGSAGVKHLEYKVGDDLKVVVWANDKKKEQSPMDAFKSLPLGTTVTLKMGDGDAVTGVTVGTPPKTTNGTFTSYKDGTLTLKVKTKNGEESKDFKVADDTKSVTLTGKDKKEGIVKDALKDVTEGTPVTLTLGAGNKVTEVQVGKATKKNNK
jgi:hypothetical protein